jgi:2-amino-4-hydroxy-6-hydroxymethyldihydropteridine diphosphokinase
VKIAYLGLGSNLGKREEYLQRALDALQAPRLRILRVSSVYESAPVDMLAQPWFLNLAAEAECGLMPLQLLAHTAKVERALGRKRLQEKGPRTVDVDILFYGSFVVRTPRLVIPHARFAERRFVLEPMAELAPDFRDPNSRRSMRELLADVTNQTVRKTSLSLRVP